MGQAGSHRPPPRRFCMVYSEVPNFSEPNPEYVAQQSKGVSGVLRWGGGWQEGGRLGTSGGDGGVVGDGIVVGCWEWGWDIGEK